MLFLKSKNVAKQLEENPFSFPQIFLPELDGTMTLSKTIQLEQGKVLIFQKDSSDVSNAYAFVVCWDKRLDWTTFETIYNLYEENVAQCMTSRELMEPVFIAKSIDNDVLRFIQTQTEEHPFAHPLRAFTH